MKNTFVYIYRLTADTGLAPCVENNLFSLACCKGGWKSKKQTGLRYFIGSKEHADWETDNVYVVGIYKNKILYCARITEVLEMTEYYKRNGKSKGRTDDIYTFVNGKLERNNKLPKWHPKDDNNQYIKDTYGKYVLLSDDYKYMGVDAKDIDFSINEGIWPKKQELKRYKGEKAKEIVKYCNSLCDKKEHSPNSPIIRGCK